MPSQFWPLVLGRPGIEIVLTLVATARPITRQLLADTGAGSLRSTFELILAEQDCLSCGGKFHQSVILGGSYTGTHRAYLVCVQVPQFGFNRYLRVVGVPRTPANFDGIACFRFLNRFTFGNFGDPSRFGLEL